MINEALYQEIDDEYFIRMMIPKIRRLAAPFEDEEWTQLSDLLRLVNHREYQLVVVGAGTLSYVELASKYGIPYVAVEPLVNTYLQKQVRFVVELHKNITCIDKGFGDFDGKQLGVKRNIFAFIFNILGYIEDPIHQINKYIQTGDIIFIASWNKNENEAMQIRDQYFSVLNETSPDIEAIYNRKETIGLCNLDYFDFHKLRSYKSHRRIKNQITDILIINC